MRKMNKEVKSIWRIRRIAMGNEQKGLDALGSFIFVDLSNDDRQNELIDILSDNFNTGCEIKELIEVYKLTLDTNADIKIIEDIENDKIYEYKFDDETIMINNPEFERVNIILNQIEELVK